MDGREQDAKARDREIAANESERQTEGDIRVSSWAIAVGSAGVSTSSGYSIAIPPRATSPGPSTRSTSGRPYGPYQPA